LKSIFGTAYIRVPLTARFCRDNCFASLRRLLLALATQAIRRYKWRASGDPYQEVMAWLCLLPPPIGRTMTEATAEPLLGERMTEAEFA